jgi:hypothetical protein
MFFGSFLVAVALVTMARRWHEGKANSLWCFASLWATVMLLYGMPLYIPAYNLVPEQEEIKAISGYTEALNKYIDAHKATGKNVLFLSYNLAVAFPAMNYLPVRFPGHFHELWTLPAIVKEEQSASGLGVPLRQVKAFTLQTLAQDLKKYLPELVVVDSNTSISGVQLHSGFITYLSQDAGFRSQWNHYVRVGVITVNGDGTVTVKDKENGDEGKTPEYVVYARRH